LYATFSVEPKAELDNIITRRKEFEYKLWVMGRCSRMTLFSRPHSEQGRRDRRLRVDARSLFLMSSIEVSLKYAVGPSGKCTKVIASSRLVTHYNGSRGKWSGYALGFFEFSFTTTRLVKPEKVVPPLYCRDGALCDKIASVCVPTPPDPVTVGLIMPVEPFSVNCVPLTLVMVQEPSGAWS